MILLESLHLKYFWAHYNKNNWIKIRRYDECSVLDKIFKAANILFKTYDFLQRENKKDANTLARNNQLEIIYIVWNQSALTNHL